MLNRTKEQCNEFGDWQTNYEFARIVCQVLKSLGFNPQVVIEPTCGRGNFIKAALATFDEITDVFGIEIYKPYLDSLKDDIRNEKTSIHLFNEDIFHFDFAAIRQAISGKRILILGNPPWITNSELGKQNGNNIPIKTNKHSVKGLDALTGKSNFDIAESICDVCLSAFANEKAVTIALLLKNSVIKNILLYYNKRNYAIDHLQQFEFDAKKEFNVSVAASLFIAQVATSNSNTISDYDLYSRKYLRSYGWFNGFFVSNLDSYKDVAFIEGESQFVWRSGIKHDCSKILELTKQETDYYNDLGEKIDVEKEFIYPLVKSSDIGYGFRKTRKYILLPQRTLKESNHCLQTRAPKAFAYFQAHKDYFSKRKSSIYKGKQDYSVFGIGNYTFTPYKVGISSLYREPIFSTIGQQNDATTILDDTCYMLGFDKQLYAEITTQLLNTPIVIQFLKSIGFLDAKRVVSRETLMRIDLLKVFGISQPFLTRFSKDELDEYKNLLISKSQKQLSLLLE